MQGSRSSNSLEQEHGGSRLGVTLTALVSASALHVLPRRQWVTVPTDNASTTPMKLTGVFRPRVEKSKTDVK